MALVGGGTSGAGNTVNPTGTGTSINYIGNHAYATSGSVSVGNSQISLCDFSTGSEYIVGTAMFSSGTQSGDDYQYSTIFNGEIVDRFHTSGGVVAPDRVNRQIIIPPYTRVQFTAQNVTDASTGDQQVFFQGEVHYA